MPLTRPIPDEALPAVALVRQYVRKPVRPPRNYLGGLMWLQGCGVGCLSEIFVPDGECGAGGFLSLYAWWYEQTDGQSAMDALWGPQPCP